MLERILRWFGYEEPLTVAAAQRARREAMAMQQEADWAGWSEWSPTIAERLRQPLAAPKPMRRRRK
jgi:hypothetical protein